MEGGPSNRSDGRRNACLKTILSFVILGAGRDEEAAGRLRRKRDHSTKQVAMGSTSAVCEEDLLEGRHHAHVHRLQRPQLQDHQKPVPATAHRRHDGPPTRRQGLLDVSWVDFHLIINLTDVNFADRLQDSLWSLRVSGNALRSHQCARHLPTPHERDFEALSGRLRHRVP